MEVKDDFKRTEKSIANAFTGIIGQIIQYIFHYAVRTVFIYNFGKTYLGLNGLFTNILSILNLAELGIGTAIIYQLYETIAKKDIEKTKQYLAFYKKVYRVIGFIVLGIGLAALPILPFIIKEKLDRVNIYLIYLFYLANSIFSYWFFAYRNAIITANQEQYKTQRITYLLNIISSLVQIFSMVVFKSIYAFLLIPISTTIISNLLSGILIGRWYPFIHEPVKGVLSKDEVKLILRNVYSLMLHKLSYIVLNSTDDVVLSAMAGITIVGIYSNYTLLVGAVLTAIGMMFVSMTASIGNLNIIGTKEKKLKIYEALNFAHFWLYGVSSVLLYNLLTPFITLWIGDTYLLGDITTAIICINFLTKGLRQGTILFLHACGLFYESRLAPVVSSILNILLSIILVRLLNPYNLAVAGVLIGTIISELAVTWWFDGRLVNRKIFEISPKRYYIKYWEYIIVTLVSGLATKLVYSLYQFSNPVINLIYMVTVGFAVVNIIFYLIYGRSSEFKYIYMVFKKKILYGIFKKNKS